MCEKRHLYFREKENTLCNQPVNERITALVDFPIDDFCPECLEKLVAFQTIHSEDGTYMCPCPHCLGSGCEHCRNGILHLVPSVHQLVVAVDDTGDDEANEAFDLKPSSVRHGRIVMNDRAEANI